jgi:hypothetical protein
MELGDRKSQIVPFTSETFETHMAKIVPYDGKDITEFLKEQTKAQYLDFPLQDKFLKIKYLKEKTCFVVDDLGRSVNEEIKSWIFYKMPSRKIILKKESFISSEILF